MAPCAADGAIHDWPPHNQKIIAKKIHKKLLTEQCRVVFWNSTSRGTPESECPTNVGLKKHCAVVRPKMTEGNLRSERGKQQKHSTNVQITSAMQHALTIGTECPARLPIFDASAIRRHVTCIESERVPLCRANLVCALHHLQQGRVLL